MRGFGSSLEQISNKLLSAEAAVEVVKPGHRVFVGTASATPFTLVEALERRKPTPPDAILFPYDWFGATLGRAAICLSPPLFLRRLGSARARSEWAGRICPDLAHPNPVFDGERSHKGRRCLRTSVTA